GIPVDLAVADLVVLVDAGVYPGRVHDVAVADVRGVVEDVRDVQVLQPVPGVVHHLAHIPGAAPQEVGVREAELVVQPVAVHAADDLHGPVVLLDEVVGVRLDRALQAVLLEDGHQLLHRPVELALALPGPGRVARELGRDQRQLERVGDLQQPLPVAHLRLALLFAGAGPVEDRVEGPDPHPGVLHRLLYLGDLVPVHLWVVVPLVEGGARGEIDVLVAELGGLAQLAREREVRVVHGRVQQDLHHRGLLLTSRPGRTRPGTRGWRSRSAAAATGRRGRGPARRSRTAPGPAWSASAPGRACPADPSAGTPRRPWPRPRRRASPSRAPRG